MVVLSALGYRVELEAVEKTHNRNHTTGEYHPIVKEARVSVTGYRDLQYYGPMLFGSA